MNKQLARYALLPIVIISLLFVACQPQAEPTNTPAPTDEPAATATEAETDGDMDGEEEPTETPETPEPSDAIVQDPVSEDIMLDPANIDPADEDAQLVSSYLYEGLVRMEDGSVAPALATDWIISDDGLDYIFELRPNVFFHDGTSLDADAVLANFNRWYDPDHRLRGDGEYQGWEETYGGFKGEVNDDGTDQSSFDGIEKVDNLTVLIHLNRQVPNFLEKLSLPFFGIVSPDALAAQGDAFGTVDGGAVGTGSYMLEEWTEAHILLAPYAQYWDEPAETGVEFPIQ